MDELYTSINRTLHTYYNDPTVAINDAWDIYEDYHIKDTLFWVLNRCRYMFYLATPSETMFPEISQVPRLVVEMFPFFILLSVLENVARFFAGKSISRMNDTVASISQGIFQDCLRIKVRSIEILVYCFFYNNLRLWTLPWNSVWTWYFCFITIDFGFYWAHRFAHEVNFIWAIHQAHHSAEDFTLPSGLRQALLQPFTAWFTYWPLAMSGIPPAIFLAHLQLGELYMFWLHTEMVPKLGPLEYILNTPSHHRVHHARNPQYIDKNYGGVFIFWDFLFNSFKAEDPNDPPAYGLVHPVQSYNPFYLQLHHWGSIFTRIKTTPGLLNKLKVPFYGPGWDVGKPRLGYIHEIPEIKHPVQVWDPPMNLLQKSYVLIHFSLVVLFYHELSMRNGVLNQFIVTIGIIVLLFSITSLGFILENRWFAPATEFIRCAAFFGAGSYIWPVVESIDTFELHRIVIIKLLRILYLTSVIICGIICLIRFSSYISNYKKLQPSNVQSSNTSKVKSG